MIGAETSRNTYTGNGSVSNYSYSYPIEADADLIVRVLSPAGVQHTLVLTTDYTVNDAGDPDGGSIDLVAGSRAWLTANKLTTSWKIIVRRRVELTQEVQFSAAGGNLLSILQDELDRVVMQMQGMQDELNRSVKLPETLIASDFDPTLPADFIVNGVSKVPATNASANGWQSASTWPSIDNINNAQSYADDAEASATAAAASQSAAAVSAAAAATAQGLAEDAQAAAEAAQLAAEAAAATVVAQGPFTIVDSQVGAADITNFKFLTSSAVGSFVLRYTRGLLGGVMTLRFYKDGAGVWNIAPPLEDGEPSGLTLTLATVGLYQQVQYESDNTGAGQAHWVGSSI